MPLAPGRHGDQAGKRARVRNHPVGRLNELVERWRLAGPKGGPGSCPGSTRTVRAPRPGPSPDGVTRPQTVAAGDLGFSSLDNEDPTTQQVRGAMTPSRLDPGRTACAGTSSPGHCTDPRVDAAAPGSTTWKRRPPGPDRAGQRTARSEGGGDLRRGGTGRVGCATSRSPTAPVVVPALAVPHPSPANRHRRHEALQLTTTALDRAADLCR